MLKLNAIRFVKDIHLSSYTKGKAVGFLSKKLGIDYEDTFAFGVTDDVASDGIYNALIKYKVI